MPKKITISLEDYELKLIKRLARHQRRSVPTMVRALMRMSLNMIRIEENTGWCYSRASGVPPIRRMPVYHKFRNLPFFEGWTKEERDEWILTGKIPDRIIAPEGAVA